VQLLGDPLAGSGFLLNFFWLLWGPVYIWLPLALFGFFWGCLRNQLRLLLVFGEGGHRFSGELVWENCATEWGV